MVFKLSPSVILFGLLFWLYLDVRRVERQKESSK